MARTINKMMNSSIRILNRGLQFKLTVAIITAFLFIILMRSVFLEIAINWTDNFLIINIASGLISIILFGLITFLVIRQFIRKPLDNLTKLGILLGENNFSSKIEIKTKDEFGQLADVFNHTVDNLRLLIEQVQDTAENVSSGSAQLASSTQQIGVAGEEISKTVQELANGC